MLIATKNYQNPLESILYKGKTLDYLQHLGMEEHGMVSMLMLK
jgi:hypothetical protein